MMMKGFEENVVLTNANTQYSFLLPKNTKSWNMKVRDGVTAYWARTPGKVAPVSGAGSPTAPYITIPDGNTAFEGPTNAHQRIYFASPTAGAVIEIWGDKDAQR